MPTISIFYGQIRMFFHDTDKHHAPHIHADYRGQVAVYSIEDGTVLALSSEGNKFFAHYKRLEAKERIEP